MDEQTYQTNPSFILREIGGEAVLVPVGAVGELENCVISLNSTYCFLWKQFEQPASVSEVIARAKEHYDDPEGVMERQIKESVEELVKRTVLRAV